MRTHKAHSEIGLVVSTRPTTAPLTNEYIQTNHSQQTNHSLNENTVPCGFQLRMPGPSARCLPQTYAHRDMLHRNMCASDTALAVCDEQTTAPLEFELPPLEVGTAWICFSFAVTSMRMKQEIAPFATKENPAINAAAISGFKRFRRNQGDAH